jgi:hypothetical protein
LKPTNRPIPEAETVADLPSARSAVVTDLVAGGSGSEDTAAWSEQKDPKTGKAYYFNAKTKRATWCVYKRGTGR